MPNVVLLIFFRNKSSKTARIGYFLQKFISGQKDFLFTPSFCSSHRIGSGYGSFYLAIDYLQSMFGWIFIYHCSRINCRNRCTTLHAAWCRSFESFCQINAFLSSLGRLPRSANNEVPVDCWYVSYTKYGHCSLDLIYGFSFIIGVKNLLTAGFHSNLICCMQASPTPEWLRLEKANLYIMRFYHV